MVFTAHYDTAPRLPFPNICTPKNIGLYLLYQVGMTLGILAIPVLLGVALGMITKSATAAFFVSYAALVAVMVLMLAGPANPHTVNDNSSGVAAVLELMARIPPEQRGKAAFILFDNEEMGLLGSAAYASKHKAVKQNTLIVNMDCVGEGEHMLFFANKAARALPAYAALTAAMEKQQGMNLLMNDAEKCIYPSDQANYKVSVAVCACSRTKRGIYYFAKIHTPKDTVCDQRNLDFLTGGLADFVTAL